MSGELVHVNLRRDGRFRLACPACGATMGRTRSIAQTARELPLGTAVLVVLVYEAVQGRRSACGSCATIHPPGIDPHAKAPPAAVAAGASPATAREAPRDRADGVREGDGFLIDEQFPEGEGHVRAPGKKVDRRK